MAVDSEDLRELAQAVVSARQMNEQVVSTGQFASPIEGWEARFDLAARIGKAAFVRA
jgi:hypothetical protein